MDTNGPQRFILRNQTYDGVNCEPLYNYLHQFGFWDVCIGIISPSWYGYNGLWSIDDGKLYLIDFHAYVRYKPDYLSKHSNVYKTKPVGLDYLFPNQSKVFADWYSREITLVFDINDTEEKATYDEEGIYRRAIYLTFENGVLVNEKIFIRPLSERLKFVFAFFRESNFEFSLRYLFYAVFHTLVLPFYIPCIISKFYRYLKDRIWFYKEKK